MNRLLNALGFAALTAGGAACSVLKADPAADTGFLPHGAQLAPLSERSPFGGVWYADKSAFYKVKPEYHRVLVLPVDTTYLESKIRGEKLSKSVTDSRIEDLHELARYAEERMRNALKDYPDNPLKLVDEIGPHTLVIEMAIVELRPTLPAINVIGTAAGAFVPGGGLIKVAATGSVAMETIVRDGESGDVLVEIKDREKDKSAPFTVRDFEEYGHARRTIDEWAGIFAELAATPYSHKVDGLYPVTLNPL